MQGKDCRGDRRVGGVHRKDARSRALFLSQHHVASVAQLLDIGYGEKAVKRRVASGEWRRIHKGVVAPAWGNDPLQPFMAASLATDGILSHTAGLVVWGVGEGRPEVTIDLTRRIQIEGVSVYRARDSGERVNVGVLPVHPIERVLCDAGHRLGPEEIQNSLELAIKKRLTTIDRLGLAVRENRNRPGVATLRSLLEFHMSGTRSVAEARAWRVLLSSGLPRPQRQFAVGPYQLDFAWPEQMVCLEADGFAFHSSARDLERDAKRQNYLMLQGWLVLRYGWVGINRWPDRLVREVSIALAARAKDALRPANQR